MFSFPFFSQSLLQWVTGGQDEGEVGERKLRLGTGAAEEDNRLTFTRLDVQGD